MPVVNDPSNQLPAETVAPNTAQTFEDKLAALDFEADMPPDDFDEPASPTPAPAPAQVPTATNQPSAEPVPAESLVPAANDAADGAVTQQQAQQTGNQQEVTFPADLLSEAGISEQAARQNFGTPERLQQAVIETYRNTIQHRRQMVANQQQQLPSLTHQQAQPAPVQQPAQQQQDELFKPFSLKDPDTWGPDTKELVDQLNAHFKDTFDRAGQQIGQLKQNLTVSMEREQAQQVQHYVRTFDNTVNGLGEGWDKVFGQGDASTLNRSSAEFRNRVRLDQAVAEVCAARQVAGLPQIPTEVAIQRALQVEYAKESADIAREQLARKATGRQSQFINRPSARRGAGITPTEKATDFVSGFFKDRGIASAVDDDIPTDL